MKLGSIVLAIALVVSLSGCYDYNYHGGNPYWYNHGWYGGDRFYHNGPAFGHEFGTGHFSGHEYDHHDINHNGHNGHGDYHSGH